MPGALGGDASPRAGDLARRCARHSRTSRPAVIPSSGDTIPNCLGELGEIRERTGIAADGHPAGAPGATGVERLRPQENVQRGKRCQEPKYDLLASICPKWVPDTLSALSRAEPVNVRFYALEQQALPRSCTPLPLPSRLLAPTTGLRHDQRMSPFPSPHHSKNRPTLTWKSPSRSGMVNSSSAPSKRVVPSAR